MKKDTHVSPCDEFLNLLRKKSPWICWLTEETRIDGRETREFLRRCCARIRHTQHLLKRVREDDDPKNIGALVFELITFELLYRLALKPEFQPRIGQLRPDMVIHSDNMRFLA